MLTRLVDIWRKDFDSFDLCLVDLHLDTIHIFLIRYHQCYHEFCWIVCLHICSLVGDHRVTGCMRLVKSITSKRLNNLIKDIYSKIFFMSLGMSRRDEFVSLFHEEIVFLLTDSTTEYICFTKRKTCKCLYELHNLFLVYCNSIGWFQDCLE